MSVSTIGTFINVFADACAIVTAGIAVWFYVRVKCGENHKRTKLENYLKAEKATGEDQGKRSLLNIVAKVGLSEDEILKASFQSPNISRALKTDKEGYAAAILLWYDEKKP
jgi:hypothetical protein